MLYFLIFLSGLVFAQEKIAHEFQKLQVLKELTLRAAIEQGLRENLNEHQRSYQGLILEDKLEGVEDKFWYPNVNLIAETTYHRVTKVKSFDQNSLSSKVPTGKFGIEVENYNVFNWGKDYLDYQMKKVGYKRDKEVLFEQRRNLVHRSFLPGLNNRY